MISNKLPDENVFPKYCRNGVLFGDLLNKLSGRFEESIKGLNRTPNSMTAINANYEKTMNYLREFPRFSSRYLWSQSKLIEGNEAVIWGFLDDIWHWTHNKTSPHDPAANVLPQSTKKQLTRQQQMDDYLQTSI